MKRYGVISEPRCVSQRIGIFIIWKNIWITGLSVYIRLCDVCQIWVIQQTKDVSRLSGPYPVFVQTHYNPPHRRQLLVLMNPWCQTIRQCGQCQYRWSVMGDQGTAEAPSSVLNINLNYPAQEGWHAQLPDNPKLVGDWAGESKWFWIRKGPNLNAWDIPGGRDGGFITATNG